MPEDGRGRANMSLSRTDLLTYLQNSFDVLATETGVATTDTAAGFGSAIDYALRRTGTLHADLATGTIPDDEEDAGYLFASYAALQRYLRALAIQVDITVDGPDISKKRSQTFAHVKILLDTIKDDLALLGYGEAAFEMGRINLDFLEPEEVA